MKTSYDPEADVFYARFAAEEVKIIETEEVAPGVFIDLDDAGDMVGIEVLSVRLRSSRVPGKMRVAETVAE